jgi:hypothetical protein
MKGDTKSRFDAHAPNIILATALTAISCIYYLAVLTDGDWNLFGAEFHGLVFNDMLAHLLRGEVSASPSIAYQEAFLSRGRIVVYWGIFPAFLRLPLVPINALYELQIARLSCWAAICSVASFLVANLIIVYRVSAPSARSTFLFHILVVGTLFSGTVLTNLAIAYVYNEPIFWAVALSVAFNYIVLRRVIVDAQLTSLDLLVLACIAGLTLNCRVLEGIGLYLAIGWILLLTVFAGGEGTRTKPTVAVASTGLRKAIAPATILVVFVTICGAVNYMRWGSPLSFADLHHHIYISANPRRLAVLNTFGELNVVRIPFSLAYFFLGKSAVDALEPLFSNFGNLYDGIEGPSSSFALTDTVTFILGALGVRFVFRGLAALRPRGTLLVAGVLVCEFAAIGVLLAADYLAMRYRMDFVPAMSFAAAIGYLFLSTKTVILNRVFRGALLLLTAISIATSNFILIRYKGEVAQFNSEGRLYWGWYQCAKNPKNCSP